MNTPKKVTPVVRKRNKSYFLNPDEGKEVEYFGEVIRTAPLLVPAPLGGVNLIAISSPSNLTGFDERAGLNPDVRLENIYVRIKGNTAKSSCSGDSGAAFYRATMGSEHQLSVHLVDIVFLDADFFRDIARYLEGDFTKELESNPRCWIRVEFFGTIDLETGFLDMRSVYSGISGLFGDKRNFAWESPFYKSVEELFKHSIEYGVDLSAHFAQ